MHARKLLAGLATTAVALSAVTLSATPAWAADPDDTTFAPVSADLVGVGSDTSQHAVKLLADAYNAQTPTPAARIATYAATGGGTIAIPGGDITRPNGSGAGKALLFGAGDDPDVDFARSSSAQSVAETNGGLKSFPFALDTLVMVTATTTNAPVALTNADIVKIYDGTFTNWNQVTGGTAGVIAPKIPQAGSGTRSFFVAQLKSLNGGVDVVLAPSVASVQEHDDTDIKNDPNAVAPFSQGRNSLLAAPLRVETGFTANRALYTVVRGADVSTAAVQSAFGADGFLCSTAARPLIEQAGFKQLARPANSGVCGTPVTDATSNFTLNEQVVTTTTLTVGSTTAGQAKLTARVTGSTSPTGTVAFFKGATLLASGVPLTSGQAVRSFSATPGSQTYRAQFTPTGGSPFEASQDQGTGFVKTSSKVSEAFPKAVEAGKRAKGAVTVTLAGISLKAAGSVTVKEGKKVLVTKALKGGKVTIKLPKFKTTGKHTLTIVWAGDANAVGSKLEFKIKQKKPKN